MPAADASDFRCSFCSAELAVERPAVVRKRKVICRPCLRTALDYFGDNAGDPASCDFCFEQVPAYSAGSGAICWTCAVDSDRYLTEVAAGER